MNGPAARFRAITLALVVIALCATVAPGATSAQSAMAVVRGVVTDSSGRPVAGVTVERWGGESWIGSTDTTVSTLVSTTETDSNGRYRFEFSAPAEASFRFLSPRPESSDEVRPLKKGRGSYSGVRRFTAGSVSTINVELRDATVVRGRVTGDDGKAMRGVWFSITSRQTTNGFLEPLGFGLTDARGEYSARFPSDDPVSIEFTARRGNTLPETFPGYDIDDQPRYRLFGAGRTVVHDQVLHLPARIVTKVLADGNSYAGAEVILYRERVHDSFQRLYTSATGRIVFSDLRAGRYLLLLPAVGEYYEGATRPSRARRIVVAVGETVDLGRWRVSVNAASTPR